MGEYKDFRRKLTQEQKSEIKNRFNSGEKNRKKLAAEFGVSKGTINFIVNPGLLLRFNAKKKGTWRKYYTTEKARIWKRKYRERRKTQTTILL